mmetsp:Transcript_146339/g.258513  ORF Transcript_146339/g.258513 Transcript_146339/m.258513 type:complete len:283 (-) Transcript_146339:409-1257(-)
MEQKPLVAALNHRSIFQKYLYCLDVFDGPKRLTSSTLALLADGSPVQRVRPPEIPVHISHHRYHSVPLRNWLFVIECAVLLIGRTLPTMKSATSVTCPIVFYLVSLVDKHLKCRNALRLQLEQALEIGASAYFRPVERSCNLRRCQASPIFRAPRVHGPLVATLAELHGIASILLGHEVLALAATPVGKYEAAAQVVACAVTRGVESLHTDRQCDANSLCPNCELHKAHVHARLTGKILPDPQRIQRGVTVVVAHQHKGFLQVISTSKISMTAWIAKVEQLS